MNEKYTAQAATQEEAISKGLDALGITKEEAIITVEEAGKKGFFGIGQRDAVVVVETKEKTSFVDKLLAEELELETEEVVPAEVVKKAKPVAKSTKKVEKPAVTKAPVEAKPKKVEKPAVKTVEESSDEIVKLNDEEAIEAVREYLKDIIQAMDISDVEVYASRVKEQVKYDIETQNAGLVIGRHGKVLNGLQTLTQNHMHQLAENKIFVSVDAEKYRERRRGTVENLARRTADRAIKSKRRVKLDPMPAHERKQIHHYLNGNPKVQTHSEGREPKRYLVVQPVEQPEQ